MTWINVFVDNQILENVDNRHYNNQVFGYGLGTVNMEYGQKMEVKSVGIV